MNVKGHIFHISVADRVLMVHAPSTNSQSLTAPMAMRNGDACTLSLYLAISNRSSARNHSEALNASDSSPYMDGMCHAISAAQTNDGPTPSSAVFAAPDAVRPPQALLSKTICSSHSSSGVLPVSSKFRAVQPHLLASSWPPRRPHGPAFLWRHRGPLEVLAVQPLFWRPRLLRLTICKSCNMKESDSERPVLHTNVHLINRHLLSI